MKNLGEKKTTSFPWRSLVGLIVIFTLLYLVTQGIGEERIEAWIRQAGPFAPVVLILLKITAIVYAPLSGTVLYLLAGRMFGVVPGTIYIVIGDVIGGSIAFLISRYLGTPIVAKFLGRDGIERMDSIYDRSVGWKGLLIARLIFVHVTDIINYAAGFTQIPFWQFIAVVFCGSILPSFLFVSIGAALFDYLPIFIVVSAIATISTIVFMFIKGKTWVPKSPDSNNS